jgi:hypothetical protein
MNKPKIFISSTIYDFSDLRSALKFWLQQMGFEAQLSEYNDFQKDLTMNSYDACVKSVSECDYFVLLIGSRRGGMCPDENISITRKEYRAAYELAQIGKIKKLIVFIRRNVWDVKEDRKALGDLLNSVSQLDNEEPIDRRIIKYHSSNILKDAEHILAFIDEVTRIEDARSGNRPVMNWVHTFTSFEDVITTLNIELQITASLSVKAAEQSIRAALIYNLQNITYRSEEGNVCAYYLPFKSIREKIKAFRDTNAGQSIFMHILLTKEEVNKMSDFVLFLRYGISDLLTFEFENAINSGVFLTFNRERNTYENSALIKALKQMIREIFRLKKLDSDFSLASQDEVIATIRNMNRADSQKCSFKFHDLAMISSFYERLFNIELLTQYMIVYLDKHDDKLDYPVLLNGFVNSDRPTEEEISRLYTDN